MDGNVLKALFLGGLEGLTEFLPVSSTGHLLLAGELIGFESTGHTFEILIQLGAILAIIGVYFGRLTHLALTAPHDRESRHFIFGILLAFAPAVVVGVLARDFIKQVLFETPLVICISLILGGVVLAVVDRVPLRIHHRSAMHYSLPMYLCIGLFQCLAMIPGVSRSGATIVGALLMGASKRSAAEFSFFLAIPTMAGAFAYDLLKSFSLLSFDDVKLIAVGFVAAFITGLFAVKTFLNFVSSHGFMPFALWRLVVGGAGLVYLLA